MFCRSVIKAMPNDCLLVIFGDHGMTRTGDHGGDSKDELDAALVMYSHSQLTSSKTTNVSISNYLQLLGCYSSCYCCTYSELQNIITNSNKATV